MVFAKNADVSGSIMILIMRVQKFTGAKNAEVQFGYLGPL
jgi:hypothetical protein